MILDNPVSVRIHEVGRLFKGHPKGTNTQGKPTIGRDYNSHYLRFEPDDRFKNEPSDNGFPNLYDELKARWEKLIARGTVSVKLPFSTVEECMFLDNSVIIKWGTGTKKAASCDGKTCSLSFATEMVSGKKKYEFDRNPKPCMAGEDGICPMGCAPKALLKLIIPDLYPGGVVVFPLGSPIDIDSVRGTLTRFERFPLDGIPFALFRKAARVNYSDDRGEQSRDNWGVNLDIDPIAASKLMAKTDRRFDRFLESDDDEMIDAEVVPQQRSIAPAKAPNFKQSDDGYVFLQQLRAAISEGSIELLSEAVTIAKDLVESGYYDRSGLNFINYEEERARSAIRDLGFSSSVGSKQFEAPTQTKQPLTPAQVKINFFRLKTECTAEDIRAICQTLDYPQTSLEITEDQASVIVCRLLIEWAVEAKGIDRSIAARLVPRSVGRGKTDEEIWEGFTLSIESYELENKAV